jgi:hypothetical protein
VLSDVTALLGILIFESEAETLELVALAVEALCIELLLEVLLGLYEIFRSL